MPAFDQRIQSYLDMRTSTLGRIKSRSLGADALTLTALAVLVYAQLEGGIKDLASCVFRDLNIRRMPLGEINPGILRWRNPDEINRLRSMVDFDMVALESPFKKALDRRFKIRGIDRRKELNQMSWEAIKNVYAGLNLNYSEIEQLKTKIDEIVEERNDAAHHGVLPTAASAEMEKRIRENATVVENVLTHLSIQLLPFFTARMHRR